MRRAATSPSPEGAADTVAVAVKAAMGARGRSLAIPAATVVDVADHVAPDNEDMAGGLLRLELRTALFRAGQSNESVIVPAQRVPIAGETENVNLQVRPIRPGDTAHGFFYAQRTVDEILRLLQPETGDRAHNLDHLDLLATGGHEDDVERRLLLGLDRARGVGEVGLAVAELLDPAAGARERQCDVCRLTPQTQARSQRPHDWI